MYEPTSRLGGKRKNNKKKAQCLSQERRELRAAPNRDSSVPLLSSGTAAQGRYSARDAYCDDRERQGPRQERKKRFRSSQISQETR